MGFYTHNNDKKSGDGLALTDWNNLSSAIGGNQGLTLAKNASDKIGIGTSNPQAKLDVNGAIYAGNSDIYFTNTNHDHTGIGNTSGYAAIENAKNFDALMILGRAGTNKGRKVRLWDYLEVNGDLSATGNVGIGTASPTERLEVAGNVKATKFIGDGSGLVNLSVGLTGLNLATTSGNIGIGTASPVSKLDVNGDINFTGNLKQNGIGIFTNRGGDIYCNARVIRNENSDYKDGMYIGYNSAGGNDAHIRFYANGTNERMTIRADSGNVGIGTGSPTARLTISGGAIQPSAGNSETSGIMFPKDPGGGGGDAAWIRYYARTGESTTLEIGTSNDADDHIALMPTGNVGIGTNNPTQKLEVNGNIKMSAPGNDFVMFLPPDNQRLVFYIKSSTWGSDRYMSWDGDTNWDSYSDKRLKTNIEDEKNILERLIQLNVKNYNWKNDPDRNPKPIGFIAQDVQPLFPALVKEVINEETKEPTLTLPYASFGVLAVGAIKELKAEMDKEIAELKQKIAELSAK